MNANEVIATLASKSSNIVVNPNDHINAQNGNDVIPTAIYVGYAIFLESLIPIEHLISAIDESINPDTSNQNWSSLSWMQCQLHLNKRLKPGVNKFNLRLVK